MGTLGSNFAVIEKVVFAFASVRDFTQLAVAWQKAVEIVALPDYSAVYLCDLRHNPKPQIVTSRGLNAAERLAVERSAQKTSFEIDWPAHAKSRFMVSISSQGKIVGYLGIASRKPTAFDKACVELVRFATTIAQTFYSDLSYWIAFRESTEQVLAEQQRALIHSSKMSALGKMASGIAHEVNNPLAIICCKAQLLADLAQSGELKAPEAIEEARKIEETAMRIAKIVRGLRTFAREGGGDAFQQVGVRALVDDTLAFCRESLRKRQIELSVGEFSEELTLECSVSQLAQVFLNLLSNAADALDEVQTKWIRLEVKDDGEFVEFSVTDSGPGIASVLREKVFEPFFTTKEPGKGTGLGLSISLGIVEGHNGKMSVDPASANTRFVVRLPKAQPRVTMEAA